LPSFVILRLDRRIQTSPHLPEMLRRPDKIGTSSSMTAQRYLSSPCTSARRDLPRCVILESFRVSLRKDEESQGWGGQLHFLPLMAFAAQRRLQITLHRPLADAEHF